MTVKPKRYGFCVYCGAPTLTPVPAPAPITCLEHHRLVERDPNFTIPDQWADA